MKVQPIRYTEDGTQRVPGQRSRRQRREQQGTGEVIIIDFKSQDVSSVGLGTRSTHQLQIRRTSHGPGVVDN